MRLSILLGREHGSDELTVLEGPADPVKVNAAYKEAVLAAELGEIQLWSSHGGLGKRKTFSAPPAKSAPEPEEDTPEEDALDSLTIPQLRALAEDEGVDLGAATLKADIIAAIQLARESGPML